MKKIIFCVFTGILLLGCNSSVNEINYRGNNYTIEDSEFGVAFIDKFNSIEYYMDKTIYKCGSDYYCLISDAQNTKNLWIMIQGSIAKDIDSMSVDFKSCKEMDKRELLDR